MLPDSRLDALFVICWLVAVALVVGATIGLANKSPPKPFTAYCVDPVVSEDMGSTIYSPCVLVRPVTKA